MNTRVRSHRSSAQNLPWFHSHQKPNSSPQPCTLYPFHSLPSPPLLFPLLQQHGTLTVPQTHKAHTVQSQVLCIGSFLCQGSLPLDTHMAVSLTSFKYHLLSETPLKLFIFPLPYRLLPHCMSDYISHLFCLLYSHVSSKSRKLCPDHCYSMVVTACHHLMGGQSHGSLIAMKNIQC